MRAPESADRWPGFPQNAADRVFCRSFIADPIPRSSARVGLPRWEAGLRPRRSQRPLDRRPANLGRQPHPRGHTDSRQFCRTASSTRVPRAPQLCSVGCRELVLRRELHWSLGPKSVCAKFSVFAQLSANWIQDAVLPETKQQAKLPRTCRAQRGNGSRKAYPRPSLGIKTRDQLACLSPGRPWNDWYKREGNARPRLGCHVHPFVRQRGNPLGFGS